MIASAKPAPLFQGLQDDQLRALSDHAVAKTFPKNTIIINEGDETDSLYVIVSGRVKIFLSNENGKEIVLTTEGPGEYFGEMVLDEGPRSASVMTLEPCKFLVISKAEVQQFLSKHPDFAMHLVHKLIHRVRVLTENVKSLALQDVYGRFARMLHELATERDGKLVIAEKLTQQDMASRIGASREMISLIIKDLTTGGYVSVNRKKIVINKKLPLEW
jgi:CRP/FNR family transcriptional regulator, cyclic AMP receptor protein